MPRALLAAWLAAGLLAGPAGAEQLRWWDGFALQGLSGPVHALAIFQGELVAAGDFEQAGGRNVYNLARFDGSAWRPLGDGLRRQGEPGGDDAHGNALLVHDGELWVGGHFDLAGGVPIRNLARFDGTTWRADGEPSNEVHCLAQYRGNLVVGGRFYSVSDQPMPYVAQRASRWQRLGSLRPNSHVWSLASKGDSLFAGGFFDYLERDDGSAGPRTGAVALYDGGEWQPTSSGLHAPITGNPGAVFDLLVHEGRVYATGNFNSSGSNLLSGLASVGHGEASWSPVGDGLRTLPKGQGGWGFALASYRGDVYVAGNFQVGDDRHLARWDGQGLQPVPGGANDSARELLVDGHDLLVGGDFTAVGGVSSPRVARWQGVSLSAVMAAWTARGHAELGWQVEGGEVVAITREDPPQRWELSGLAGFVDPQAPEGGARYWLELATGGPPVGPLELGPSPAAQGTRAGALWPNPAPAGFALRQRQAVATPAQLRVLDLRGRERHARPLELGAGWSTVAVDAALPSGRYLVELATPSRTLRWPLTVVR